jgi:hypothetical protein
MGDQQRLGADDPCQSWYWRRCCARLIAATATKAAITVDPPRNGAIQNAFGNVADVADTSAIEFTPFLCRLEKINAPWKQD